MLGNNDNPGIIYRSIDSIFEYMETHSKDNIISVKCQFYEI
jgi:hypothetical protein